jgi:putative endonuclease
MKNSNYQTGKIGEKIAREFLIKKGYRIIQPNFRTRFGEIDLIAGIDSRLIFVEVKLKIGEDFGSPEEMVNRHKVSQVQKMAEVFLQINPQFANNSQSYQIDTVCIVLNPDQTVKRINHWENLTNEME